MRIGIWFHSSDRCISGVEYYSLGLLSGLLQVDSENEYVVYTNQPDLIDTYVRSARNLTMIEVTGVKNRSARVLWEHHRLPPLAEKDALDVLHCTSYICPLRRTSVPYVVTIHDTIALDHPRWCKPTNALYFNLVMARSSRAASCVIVVSQQTASDLKRNLGLSGTKVRMIHSGIDGIFHPNSDGADCSCVRARYRLPKRYILHVGNIEPKKNILTLIRVQAKLRELGLPHKLVIVGGRTWRAKPVLAEIQREAATGNIVQAGYVERQDLPYVYQMADAFVFPSLYEGFGFPPLEAMACGIPVVSSRRGALSETLGSAAWMVDPEDDSEIAQAVRRVVSDLAVRQRYINAGLKQSAHFNWERAAQATLAVYKEVCR